MELAPRDFSKRDNILFNYANKLAKCYAIKRILEERHIKPLPCHFNTRKAA